MFTGIIEEIGQVCSVISASGKISIRAKTVLENTKSGDSIAVNGVCLTVSDLNGQTFTADVMPETMRKSNLGCLKAGDPVNLERAVAAGGRFGGHFVSGHIDSTGIISRIQQEGNAVWISVKAPAETVNLIVQKGSIAVDGVSLTAAAVDGKGFEVSIIPHTGRQTALTSKKTGDSVNLETDVIGKYVQKLLSLNSDIHSQSITADFLKQQGFYSNLE